MPISIDRRSFLKTTATAAGMGLAARPALHLDRLAPSQQMVLAVMGTNGRGSQLAKVLAKMGQQVAYICDPDDAAIAKGQQAVVEAEAAKPKGLKDFREALDDSAVDGLVIAAPDHWHAIASIWACQAGKHVFVEKPCGHNPQEGEWLVQAARKYNRVVQMGNQRRSWPHVIEAMQALHEGAIGNVYYAKCWYANRRGSIGYGKRAAVPAGLDYELWQGPAPRVDFRDNIVHYNWHWFWHWGTAETCNNATHEVDVARWGLGVTYPETVSMQGGRYHWQDDWEMPDTSSATWTFADGKMITWEGRSCNGLPVQGLGRGTLFHGDKGTMRIDGNGYTIFDMENDIIHRVKDYGVQDQSAASTVGPGDQLDAYHLQNFVDSVQDGTRPNADIEGGHQSVLLCHLANIAWRTGRVLRCNPANGHIEGDPEAMALWGRTYEPGWEPTV